MPVSIERIAQRCYLKDLPFACKDRVQSELGANWDRDRRQWWVGAAKADRALVLVLELNNAPTPAPQAGQPAPEDPDRVVVLGKAEYKGRTYFVRAIGRDGNRCRLVTLDASWDFWCDLNTGADSARIVKRYEDRPKWDGRRRGPGQSTPMTLGRIRRFIEQQGRPETRRGRCTECDAWGPSGETCSECNEGTHL